MDVVLSAVATDLVGRLFSFLVRKYQEPGAAGNAVRLQRALLRARAVVEEAEGRQIANGAMLLQLNQLKREMCRGVYALDMLRRRATARRTLSLPPATDGITVVESLEAALGDMGEFVVLLGSCCPRVARQPCSAYLFMESCMFGRQMEKEQIIGFLLRYSQDLDVLPIIGPILVGKQTLVEHVCLDERVREHFATIHRLSSDSLDLQSHGHEGHHNFIDGTARSLIVINLAGGAGEVERWRRFYSSLLRRTHRESKVILVSRAEAHAGLGTVPALRLRAPRLEELWYFFRALAFGAADPEERPELLRVAMARLPAIQKGNPALFATAGVIAASLRADLSARSWRRGGGGGGGGGGGVFAGATKGPGVFLCQPVKDAPGVPCLFYDWRKLAGMARRELPKVTMLDMVTGRAVLPRGETRFDVLVWQSPIPPYLSHVAACDMERARHDLVAAEKRVHKRRRG